MNWRQLIQAVLDVDSEIDLDGPVRIHILTDTEDELDRTDYDVVELGEIDDEDTPCLLVR